METGETFIRFYTPADRPAVRRISYETSFLGRPEIFQLNAETVADVLTAYYTDFYPQSTFVAYDHGRVVGYLTGDLDTPRMNRVMAWRVMPVLVARSACRGDFFRAGTWWFLIRFLHSILRGEFRGVPVLKDYPAGFHINLLDEARGKGLGGGLIQRFLSHAAEHQVRGVHCGTMSETAKAFFVRQGFRVLGQTRRSYLDKDLQGQFFYYMLGRPV